MQPHKYLEELLRQRQALQGILKNGNALDGVTFMVRKGIADADDCDDRLGNWVTIPVAVLGEARYVLLGLLRTNEASIKVLMRSTAIMVEEAGSILAEAHLSMLEDENHA